MADTMEDILLEQIPPEAMGQDDGEVNLDAVIKGDTVREVLDYVQYSAEELTARMRKDVERAVRSGKISLEESRQMLGFYESGLEGYTYLEEP